MDGSNEQQNRRRYEADLNSNDPYAVLGLEAGAAPRAVKRAYFSLVREYPPEDRPDEFMLLRAAYEQLRDPAKKAAADLFRIQPPDVWQPRKRRRKFQLEFDPQDVVRILNAQVSHGDVKADFRPITIK